MVKKKAVSVSPEDKLMKADTPITEALFKGAVDTYGSLFQELEHGLNNKEV